MGFVQAITSGFSHYVAFSGRAIRSEYWYWVLFTIIGSIIAGILDTTIFGVDYTGGPTVSPLDGIFSLVTFLPSLAVSIRRLHDIDRTGWWVLLALTLIGAFVLIYWACQKGTEGPNRFGPDRLGAIGQGGGQVSQRPAA
jgi:uncharacterized membrane protein YhaH (DUF805 family)